MTDKEGSKPVDAKRIPLSVLIRLVENLPAHKLAELPVDQLPDHIPMHLLANAPAEKALILEEKLLEHQAFMLAERAQIRRYLGDAGLEAFELAEKEFGVEHLNTFNSRFLEYCAYKRYFDFESESDGAARLLKLLEKEQHDAEDVRHDYQQLMRAIAALDPHEVRGARLVERVHEARERLKTLALMHQKHLSQFFSERLALCIAVMKHQQQLIEHNSSELGALRQQSQLIEEELRVSEKLLTQEIYRPATQELNAHPLTQKSFRERLLKHETSYAETDLTHWMDILIDYQLHLRTSPESDKLLVKARKYLNKLLNHYFEIQELSAHSFSTDEMQYQDRSKLQRFQKKSEQYLRDYFYRRQHELRLSAKQ